MKKYENLVTVKVPLDSSHLNLIDIKVNSTLLTKITWCTGSRWNKSDCKRRRLRSLYDKKYPLLSKIFVPWHLWESDFGYYDRWYSAKVELDYIDDNGIVVYFNSNELAYSAYKLLQKEFWG